MLPLCGGNIDTNTTILGKCLEKGLAADGRLVKFFVQISDRPGGIAELCTLLGSIGVSIKDIIHERAWTIRIFSALDVEVVCETRDKEHAEQLKEVLHKQYRKFIFGVKNSVPFSP